MLQVVPLQVRIDELLKVKSLSEFLLQSMVLRVEPRTPACESSKVDAPTCVNTKIKVRIILNSFLLFDI